MYSLCVCSQPYADQASRTARQILRHDAGLSWNEPFEQVDFQLFLRHLCEPSHVCVLPETKFAPALFGRGLSVRDLPHVHVLTMIIADMIV